MHFISFPSSQADYIIPLWHEETLQYSVKQVIYHNQSPISMYILQAEGLLTFLHIGYRCWIFTANSGNQISSTSSLKSLWFPVCFKEGLEFFSVKYSEHIVDETTDSNIPVGFFVWGIWRQSKDFLELISQFKNINTMGIQEVGETRKSNATISYK